MADSFRQPPGTAPPLSIVSAKVQGGLSLDRLVGGVGGRMLIGQT